MSISTNKLAKKLTLKPEKLIQELLTLNIINDKLTLTTKGIEIGGEIKKYMGKTYINWKDEESITKALSTKSTQTKIIKPQQNIKKKITQKEKTFKGEVYEEFISVIYKANGYTIWEHGKEKGVLDAGIDLIVKKDKKIILIQCKNWNEAGKYKIDHKDIKVFRMEGLDFIEKNQIFKGYELHLKYILSGDFIHASALHHIEECNQEHKNVSYEIIKLPSVK
jgi:hypothetical protein